MKTKIFNIVVSVLALVTVTVSCVQDKEFDTPQITCNEPDVTVNATIAQVKALATTSPVQITSDLVIEGYVVSNDEAGNFYRTLHFQDDLENPTQGLQLDVDLQDMYTTYQVGKKIYIKLKGLYIQNYRSTVKLGGLYESSYGTISVGRLSAELAKTALFRSCNDAGTVTPKKTSIAGITDAMINTLVELENVEVAPANLCQTYAAENVSTNVEIQDCDGNTIILRNSGYAQFQSEQLPMGSGNIIAVLGKYDDDYQLTIRSTTDVVMNNNRCDGSTYTCETPTANATIQQIKDLYTSEKVQITNDLVFDGTITANDISGNLHKLIYVQDETSAIKVRINQTNLSSRGYNVGQKIIISAKDLYIDNVNGELTLGGLYNGNVGGIEVSAMYRHLYLQKENSPLDSTVITELTNENIGKLVQLDAVQFVDENVLFVNSGDSNTNRTVSTCDGKLKLAVRTSKYASFAKENLPSGNGAIVGILSKYGTIYQLWLRNKPDYSKMTGERCKIESSAILKTVAYVRDLFTGSSATISEDIKVKVVVTSNKDTQNTNNQNAFAQDDTAGIALRFDAEHDLILGDEIEIDLNGTELSEYNGLLQLNITATNIKNKSTGTLPTPKIITAEQALTGNYEGQLVSIENVQFKDNTKTYKGNNILTNCEKELTVYINSNATFAEEDVNTKNGTITGVMSDYNGAQLYIRDTNDVAFTDDYKDCDNSIGGGSGIGGGTAVATELYFSEYSEGSSNNKYIEIYNGTGAEIDLSNYSIKQYANGGTSPKNTLTFQAGTKLANKAVYVIYNSRADDFIKSKGNVKSAVTYFNGNDAVELLKNDTVVDVIGKVGEDPGSAWNVAGSTNATKDHTLIRKNTVTKGNIDWENSIGTDADNSEWIVKDKDDWTSVGVR